MSAPIETKVTAASTTALITAFIVGWIGTAVFHGSAVPDWLVGAIDGAVTAAAAFVAGWLAKHTPRAGDTPPSS